jgi:hypothetical protein
MALGILDQLKALDESLLLDIIRQNQNDSSFSILDWSVETLSKQGVMNSEGLWRFSGYGLDAAGNNRPWVVVLKRIQDIRIPEDIRSIWYESRDALVYESGLLEHLPGSVKPPHCYGIWRRDDSVWIWMEYIPEVVDQWSLDDYAAVACAFGQFNSAYLTGSPLPDFPWLCKRHPFYWMEIGDSIMDWSHASLQRSFSPEFRIRYARLNQDRERFLAAMEKLPQVFSHFDAHRLNLGIRMNENGNRQVVAFDWSCCGTGPVGGELYNLIGSNFFNCLFDAQEWPLVESNLIAHYKAGLMEGGAQVAPQDVRLGYALWSALWWGVCIPPLIIFWTAPEQEESLRNFTGHSSEQVRIQWAQIGEFALDLADEAREELDRRGL